MPLLVLYQLMSDMKSALSDETGFFSVAIGGAHAAGSIPQIQAKTILVHSSTAYIVVLLLVATACSSDRLGSSQCCYGVQGCGVALAIGLFQAGVAPMFWGELLRARLFVVKPYSPSTRVCPVLISEIFEPRTRSAGICLAVVGGTVLPG